ncbi:acetyl-CoA carboxylase biotin carboxyl carrier protein [Candidatus Neptunichlamydia sp. REUL1]|uniref:acetyl-CoA carboxylase biotin carboxyl carrier protein n=1 Tax=Candidatus Neptunichlamydia sp. REUL1 TaxID=3064277 RepID=UPI00292F7E53|nr:acetyl-CoA carboxylase biotin carboxyl carrier protein [Candidatus Neptunochlamydia sp. REUL1]
MDLEKIKELMEAMEDKGMTKVTLKEKNGFELELERGNDSEIASYPTHVPMVAAPRVDIQENRILPEAAKEPGKIESKEDNAITSPMVGTYYASPSPDDDPFVKIGDSVKEDTVVCIIEAMKVMNEVKAGKSGVVKEVFLNNADPVEFGTKLLTIS